jgi:hypothetical protein
MEVSVRKNSATENRSSSNSFDCESSALDAILGLTAVGKAQLRVDEAESSPKSHIGKLLPQIHAPLNVVPAASSSSFRGSNPVGLELLADAEFKRDRLVRLLDRQQAWYDAQEQAARAAEQFLSLCEHHQQQWLLPNQPTSTSQPARP